MSFDSKFRKLGKVNFAKVAKSAFETFRRFLYFFSTLFTQKYKTEKVSVAKPLNQHGENGTNWMRRHQAMLEHPDLLQYGRRLQISHTSLPV